MSLPLPLLDEPGGIGAIIESPVREFLSQPASEIDPRRTHRRQQPGSSTSRSGAMDPVQSTTWSSHQIAAARQYCRWRDAVNETHLAWAMPRRRNGAFAAALEAQGFGSARVVTCTCDPCDGARTAGEISRADAEYFGVLHVVDGFERVRQAGREAMLGPGDFTLWDSRRPIEFSVGAKLTKVTLLMPLALLTAVLPRAEDHVARTVSGASGPGALFASHLRVLARERSRLRDPQVPGLLATTIDLLGVALAPDDGAVREQVSSRSRDLLVRIQDYVLLHLGDPDLNPQRIAASHGISVRQLHRVFGQDGLMVERWIWQERLARCRQHLLRSPAAPVSAVAFQWGFNDAAHFSRAFRRRYGMSPRQYRRAAS
jgi:AraC-like DNA-binding protein